MYNLRMPVISDDQITLLLSTASLFVSILALVVSGVVAVKSWYRSRSTYELEELVLRKINGSTDDVGDRGMEAINNRLETGKYTIQSTYERKDGDVAILIAKIKK
jgi:maltodextrin utilization protein YvdJ